MHQILLHVFGIQNMYPIVMTYYLQSTPLCWRAQPRTASVVVHTDGYTYLMIHRLLIWVSRKITLLPVHQGSHISS